MIFRSKWCAAVLLMAVSWSWMTGCGPKPAKQSAEPPQPSAPLKTVESDEATGIVQENIPPEDQPPAVPADADRSEPAAASTPIPIPTPAPNVDEAPLVHKVQWGHETLYTIALWYTGKGYHWQRIAAANPGINPQRIRIGDTIRIPGSLLTTRRPMPSAYQRPAPIRKPKPIAKPPTKAPAPIQSPPLYGPVGDEPASTDGDENELPVPLETIDE